MWLESDLVGDSERCDSSYVIDDVDDVGCCEM